MSACPRSCWISLGAISGAIAVILGALAAHGLQKPLMEKYAGKTHEVMGTTIPSAQKYLGDFKTAADYQMSHSLALVLVGALSLYGRSRWLNAAGWFFLIGIFLFSGSLYVLVLTGITKLGAVTPFGGVALIAGWFSLAMAFCCSKKASIQTAQASSES